MASSDLEVELTSVDDDGEQLQLLGVDIFLNEIPKHPLELSHDRKEVRRMRCPNAIQDWGGRTLTVRERAMIRMMSEIMEKADWHRKIFDEIIVNKWYSEVVSEEENFSAIMFQFVSLKSMACGKALSEGDKDGTDLQVVH